MKKIIVLNGSPRKNGNTSQLIKSFTEGAQASGNTVTEFFLNEMDIHGCLGCFGGGKNSDSPCVQKDDMLKNLPRLQRRRYSCACKSAVLLDNQRTAENSV